MGRGGRPRKPTALKKLKGTYRKDRSPKNEPLAPVGCPVKPKGLDKTAGALWDELTPRLLEMGVLTLVDGTVLEGFVRAYSRAVAADQAVDRDGITVEMPTGPKLNPAFRVSKDSWTLVNQLGSKLGLTPSDRARLTVPEKVQADDVEANLFGGGLRVVKGGAGG